MCVCAHKPPQESIWLCPLPTFSFLYPLSILIIFFYILTRYRLISTVSILNMSFQHAVLNRSRLLHLVEKAQRMPFWWIIQAQFNHGSCFLLTEDFNNCPLTSRLTLNISSLHVCLEIFIYCRAFPYSKTNWLQCHFFLVFGKHVCQFLVQI